jgi:hypothetical protein
MKCKSIRLTQELECGLRDFEWIWLLQNAGTQMSSLLQDICYVICIHLTVANLGITVKKDFETQDFASGCV